MQELRIEWFQKVERMFMMGMRSSTPAVRQEFFKMYDERIPITLYDRLQFIIVGHDWEACATQFWLDHALVRGCLCAACTCRDPYYGVCGCLLPDPLSGSPQPVAIMPL